MELTNFSFGEAKRKQLLKSFQMADNLEKGGGKLNTSHLVLKDVTLKNGQKAKRWVDPNKGDSMHGDIGHEVEYQHQGKTLKGTVHKFHEPTGAYGIKSEDGKVHWKKPNSITKINGQDAQQGQNPASKTGNAKQPKQQTKQTIKDITEHPDHDVLLQHAMNTDPKKLKAFLERDDAHPDLKMFAEHALKQKMKNPFDEEDDSNNSAKTQQQNNQANQQDDVDNVDEEDEDSIKQSLRERFDDFADDVAGVVMGQKKSAIMYGSGGVGKTFTTKQQLEKLYGKDRMFNPEKDVAGSDDYDYVFMDGGKITPTSFFQTMWEHNGKTIVFDDADSPLEEKDIQGFLKGALGPSGQVTNASQRPVKDSNGDPIPTQFTFNGKMIFISNLSKDKMMSPKLQPLFSRSFSRDLTMSRRQAMVRIKDIATDKKTKKLTGMKFEGIPNYSHEEMDKVLSFMDKHKDKAYDLNARTPETLMGYLKMAQMRADREDERREEEGEKAMDVKEKEKFINSAFERKAIDNLYQHKMTNGKVNKNDIAKGFKEEFGHTFEEIVALNTLGLFDLNKAMEPDEETMKFIELEESKRILGL